MRAGGTGSRRVRGADRAAAVGPRRCAATLGPPPGCRLPAASFRFHPCPGGGSSARSVATSPVIRAHAWSPGRGCQPGTGTRSIAFLYSPIKRGEDSRVKSTKRPGNSVSEQLEVIHWHIRRGDNLRAAVAARVGAVLSTNALVVGGIALAFGLRNQRPNVIELVLALLAPRSRYVLRRQRFGWH